MLVMFRESSSRAFIHPFVMLIEEICLSHLRIDTYSTPSDRSGQRGASIQPCKELVSCAEVHDPQQGVSLYRGNFKCP